MNSFPRLQIIVPILFLVSWLANGAWCDEPPRINEVRVGFAGSYKLGCWTPIEVDITGGSSAMAGIVTVRVPDGDGVPTTVSTAPNKPISVEPGKKTTERLYVRIGQRFAVLQVQLLGINGDVAANRTFYSGPIASETTLASGLPATNRLVVEFGPPLGITELAQRDSRDELSHTRFAHLDSGNGFPTDWYGYEGVDVVVLTTSRADLYRPFLQNQARVQALRRWVEMGGKLVIFCGSQADELLAEGGALAPLIPGVFRESLVLEQSQEIEAFSGAESSITPNRRIDLRIPVFENLRGKVLASAERGDTEIPLVIRSYLGFGELTFVGLDFDRPPLADWPGRLGFLSKVLDLSGQTDSQRQSAGVAEVSSDDLINQVRNKLDNSFVGVEVVSFAVVALLVVGYVLLIGPGDYFLVNKVFKRPEITWISFPIAVIAVSAGAWWFANWQKGDELRVNQVEFVDVDATTGFARGTVWTHFFTPQVNKFDLSIQPAFHIGEEPEGSECTVAWLGQPGYALGGMQSGSGQVSLFDYGYTFNSNLDQMHGVPVQLWSTKTITSRWSSQVSVPLNTTLTLADDELVEGQIVNNSNQPLEDCVLLYGQWAWNIGTIEMNSAKNVLDAGQPRTVRTLLTNATAGDTTIHDTADDGTVLFRSANTDMTRLAKVIMFYSAINGGRYSGMLSRYQGFLDMSHLLQQPDVAILLSKSRTKGSQWLDADRPLTSDQDNHWIYYRFVLPVGPAIEK